METATPDVQAAPSSAPETLPNFAEFRQSENAKAVARHKGDPEPKPESTPAASEQDETSEPEKGKKAAPASEAGDKQEKPKRDDANSRIRELIAERKQLEARLEALEKGQKQDVKAESAPAPKKEQPKGLEAPKKPNLNDFTGENAWKEYEDARDKYFEDLADYKAQTRLQEHLQRQREEATQRELNTQIDKASERYGDETRTTIGSAADALMADDIPGVVKALVNDSEVMIDLLYTAGSNPDELQAFVNLAKSNPSAAVRKLVLMEGMVKDALAKGGQSETNAPERDSSGKFVSEKPKPSTKAPAIGTEVSGRGSAPPDPSETAVKTGDFKAFRDAENRKAVNRYRGQ